MSKQRKAYDRLKRGLDVVGSGVGLVALAPLIGVVGVAVRVKLGSPVLFNQGRPGRDGKTFNLYKFRSMLDVDESNGLVTNEQRLTSFGRKLRSSSLDELPSLFNVLRGDMSLVGPRPLRLDYLSRYDARQARRHEVRPGITGLAQVKGRNALSWEERFEIDVQYVDTRSLPLDFKILLQTVLQVFKRTDIVGDGMAAMSAFVGSQPNDGLTEEKLTEKWLQTRVDWLNDPIIQEGITISFEPNIDDTFRWFESIEGREDRRDWVYVDQDGESVAMAGLMGVGTPDLSLYIYVSPTQQGKGYGRMAIDRLIYRARTYGGHRLHLEVKESNSRAVQLYEHAGFVREVDPEEGETRKRAYILQLAERGVTCV